MEHTQATKNYYMEVLYPHNKQLMKETARLIAEVFTGVQVGGRYIDEPMIKALGFSRETFGEFILHYMEETGHAGLNVVAIDRETGKVIGALVSENFNPNEEIPTFGGELAPLNVLYDFLIKLDAGFIEKAESNLERKVELNDYVHLFLMGIKTEHSKRIIAADLIEFLAKISEEKGYKGIFAEATSPKSQSVFRDLGGFTVPLDISGQPVVKKYEGFEPFDTIAKEVSEECQILYRPLEEIYSL